MNGPFGEIKNAQGERLDYTYHPGTDHTDQIVVIGHGVTGHKDRPFLVALAEGLAEAGIPALRFSFAGNAGSEGAFTASNITKNTADLGAVLDALEGHTVAYAGHSMGGAVGLLRASRDDRIRLLISLAAIVHARAFAEHAFGHLTPGKDLMFDKPGCLHSQAYMDDLYTIGTLVDKAPKIAVPWLFIHGTADDLVSIQDTHDAFARASEPKKRVVLEGADHVFEEGFTPVMVDTVVRWCTEQFRKSG
jgi:alpha-beta hydrolase superfamily lysophospholipase